MLRVLGTLTLGVAKAILLPIRRRSVQELGALEDVLVALCREHQIVLGDVVPHEAVFVAPLAGPGVHGRHALPSQHVKPVNHISQVEAGLRRGERHLDEVGMLQVTAAAEVVDDRHPLPRGRGRGWRRRAARRVVLALARRLDPDLVAARARAGAGAPPPRPPLHPSLPRRLLVLKQLEQLGTERSSKVAAQPDQIRPRQVLDMARGGGSALMAAPRGSAVVVAAAVS